MKPAEHSFSDTNLWAWCPHFDHHDPTLTHANAYQIYEHLRHECPVAWSDRYDGFWVVSRYADIVTALMDPVTFSSAQGVHIPRQEGQMKSIPIDYDPPIHTQYRKIFNDALNLRLIRSREPFIRSVIVGLLAPITAKGGGELVSGTRHTPADSSDQRNVWTQRTYDLTHSHHYRAGVDGLWQGTRPGSTASVVCALDGRSE